MESPDFNVNWNTVEENISGQTQTYTIQLTNVTTTTQDVEIVAQSGNRLVDYAAVGNYTYHMIVFDLNGKERTFQGNISLMR